MSDLEELRRLIAFQRVRDPLAVRLASPDPAQDDA